MLKLRIYLQFVVSRLLGTGVDTLILWICSTFIFSSYWEVYVLSPIISFEFAVLSNFLCSYFWIWKRFLYSFSHVKSFIGSRLLNENVFSTHFPKDIRLGRYLL